MTVPREVKAVGETLLAEVPLLATPPSSPAQQKRVDAFCKTLPVDTREDRLVALLTRRWIPVLCAFADAPKGVQEAVLSLQSDFEIPECGIARATEHVATNLGLCGACSGTIPKSISRNKLSTERMHEALNVMVINAADTLPDGGEAGLQAAAPLNTASPCSYVSNPTSMWQSCSLT